MEDVPKPLIREFGVGDCDRAVKRTCLVSADLPQREIYLRINPAHEERRDRGYAFWPTATAEAADVSSRHCFVMLQRKHQRHVDVNSPGDQGFKSCDPVCRTYDLDHQVRPVHTVP